MSRFLFYRKSAKTIAALTCTAACAAVSGWLLVVANQLPDTDALKERLDPRKYAAATEIYDRNGIKIGEVASERRYFVPLEKVPSHVRKAFIAVEDKDFYRHSGVSLMAIFRAAIVNLTGGSLQGASTITQQVARLHFLDQRRTITRKVKEIMLAGLIERQLTKDQILEIYLNKVFLGNQSYGIEAAARNYFRKSTGQLTIEESAMLAGLPKAPSRLAPHKNYSAALQRARHVLKRMVSEGYITAIQAQKLRVKRPKVQKAPEQSASEAAFFIAEIQKELSRKFETNDVPLQGLKIVTTLDARLQAAAADAVKAENSRRRSNASDAQAALVSIDPVTGEILAMQGSADFKKSQFNRVLSLRRPIGAVHLPLLASLALREGVDITMPIGMTNRSVALTDMILGDMTIESAHIIETLGLGTYLEFTKSLGISDQVRDMSVALGGALASPMQVAQAFAVLASGGRKTNSRLIHSVFNQDGSLLWRSTVGSASRALDENATYVVNELLQTRARFSGLGDTLADAEASGSNSFAAVSSGSENPTDDWTVVYNPRMVTVVWSGRENRSQPSRISNGTNQHAQVAETIWQSYWANIPAEVKDNAQLLARFPAQARGRLAVAKSNTNHKQ